MPGLSDPSTPQIKVVILVHTYLFAGKLFLYLNPQMITVQPTKRLDAKLRYSFVMTTAPWRDGGGRTPIHPHLGRARTELSRHALSL